MAQRNVLGGDLEECGKDPVTGFFRDGCCNWSEQNVGYHTICAVVTDEFLEHQRSIGNDLSTPMPDHGFAGLQAGDRWCLCASRWADALAADCAPRVVLEATHARTLEWASLDELEAHRA